MGELCTEAPEEWREIPGYEGFYEASSEGRIRSLSRLGGGPERGVYRIKGRIMRVSVSRKVNVISLHRDGKRRTASVAVFVFAAWNGRFPEPGLCALHKDGDIFNNRPDNLIEGAEADRAAIQMRLGRPCGLTLMPKRTKAA